MKFLKIRENLQSCKYKANEFFKKFYRLCVVYILNT